MATTLLVDADQSSNNEDPTFPPSYSDALFQVDLTAGGIRYEKLVIPAAGGAARAALGPLERFTTVVWYTADATTQLFSGDEQSTVEQWLDLGHKTFLIFSQNLLAELGAGGEWMVPNDNRFLSGYLGATGWAADADADVAGMGALPLRGQTYTVEGAAGTPLAGMHFEIFGNTPLESTADLVNPGSGTTVLATTQADPSHTGSNSAIPIVVSRSLGTSTIIYVGMPVENIDGAPGGTSAELVHGILQFAGLL